MNHWLRYFIAGCLVFCLILVRGFERELFYDPFLDYFKGDFYNKEFPAYNLGNVLLNAVYRYTLNSVISLLIIFFLFWNKNYVKYGVYILLAFLVILLPLYAYFVQTQFNLGENFGFYIRRFLIQPYLLLILIPAFYYHQQKKAQQSY